MKKIRKNTAIAMLLVMLAVLCTFTACKPSTTEPSAEEQAEAAADMVRIKLAGNDFTYYRDTITDVMYLRYHTINAGGLTVMLDPETGLPLTYTRFVELYKNSGTTTPNDFN